MDFMVGRESRIPAEGPELAANQSPCSPECLHFGLGLAFGCFTSRMLSRPRQAGIVRVHVLHVCTIEQLTAGEAHENCWLRNVVPGSVRVVLVCLSGSRSLFLSVRHIVHPVINVFVIDRLSAPPGPAVNHLKRDKPIKS